MKRFKLRRYLAYLLIVLLIFSISVGCTEEDTPEDTTENGANPDGADENDNETDENKPEDNDEYSIKDLNEQLVMATTWYQNSAEMRALSYQAFNLAKMVYDMDLNNNDSDEKRAVIVDVDETVLDNSPYEAGLIGSDYAYPTGWDDWINSAEGTALPGSIEFLNYVVENGGDVFYVSNRKIHLLEGTMENLEKLGFPQVKEENILLREETSDKGPRREIVDENHRIVLLMGDNLNDFDSAFGDKNIEDRFEVTDTNKDKFGTKFIVLPNPMYGEWEGALYDYEWGISNEEKSQKRKAPLNTWIVE
ncbi:5'-nucleotidase, lipoprotein e(P4) family [Dethiothermospora halolimnae]|uniref:5'-nucleotidase, lipoprotein e(P4) family n=1 Tax=Dethiothermospora halolimnae TaxID=3114390 RepID=UPI003CCBD003